MAQTIVIELSEELRSTYEDLSPEELTEVNAAAVEAARRAVERAARLRYWASLSPAEAADAFMRICEEASAGLTDADRRELEEELERMS